MLPAAARVRTPAEHRDVARRGRRASSGPLTVQLMTPTVAGPVDAGPAPKSAHPGNPLGSRAGLVIPKTVGTAVARNRIRRQLRHLLADRLADLPAGSAVVVRVSPDPALPGPAAALAGDLDRALQAAALPRGPRPRGRRP